MLKATSEEWERSLQNQLKKLADAYITINKHIKQIKNKHIKSFSMENHSWNFKLYVIKRNKTSQDFGISFVK